MLTVLKFILGSGLIVLGTFFLWRLIGQGRKHFFCLLTSLLPALAVIVFALIEEQIEIALAVILGICVVNLVVAGLIVVCSQLQPARDSFIPLAWSLFGLVAILIVGGSGLNVFGGLALIMIGLIAVWQELRQTKNDCESSERCRWWNCLIVLGLIVGIMAGAWLIVKQTATISVLCGLSVIAFAVMFLSPVLGVWAGLRSEKHWQCERTWYACLWTNAIMLTIVLGLTAVCCGGIQFPKSLVGVMVPNIIGMTLITMVGLFMPQKTTRWWSGLVIAIDFIFLISWLV